MANKYRKRCSTSLVIREMQVKTIKYHWAPISMTGFKTAHNTDVGENMEQLELIRCF